MGSTDSGSSAGDGPGVRDVNGRLVFRSRWQRLSERLTGRGSAAPPGIADDDLALVVSCSDDAASSSAVLDAASWRPDDQVVVRHLLVLPSARSQQAREVAALDGYEAIPVAADMATEPVPADHELVVLARAQLIDALHLSQERSRMASLGSRHDGRAVGWQIWQRPASS